MARDQALMEEAVELLRLVGPVQARGMFGGWGLYLHGRMFGLIAEGTLFFKADDLTRPDFEQAGCRAFIYDGARRQVSLGYWTPPEAVADDARAILPWARRAVEAAERAALKKAASKRPAAKKPAAKAAAAKKPAAKNKPAAKKAPARRAR